MASLGLAWQRCRLRPGQYSRSTGVTHRWIGHGGLRQEPSWVAVYKTVKLSDILHNRSKCLRPTCKELRLSGRDISVVCMYVCNLYIYIYTHLHIDTHICIYARMHAYMLPFCMCLFGYVGMCMCMCTCMIM